VAEGAAELRAASATRTRPHDDRVRALFRGDPDERVNAASYRDAGLRVTDHGRDPRECPFTGGQLGLLADDMREHEAELEACRKCGGQTGGGKAGVRLDDTTDEGPAHWTQCRGGGRAARSGKGPIRKWARDPIPGSIVGRQRCPNPVRRGT